MGTLFGTMRAVVGARKAFPRFPAVFGRQCSGQSAHEYDIVVIGGGVPGSCLAALLGNTPSTSQLKICVLEAGPSASLQVELPEHNHTAVSSVSPSSVGVLQECGAWDDIEDLQRLAAFNSIQVWDAAGGGGVRFEADEIDEPALGYVIEDKVMQGSLHDVLRGMPESVELMESSSCTSIQFPPIDRPAEPVMMVVEGQSGAQTVTAKLVVAADETQRLRLPLAYGPSSMHTARWS